MSSIRVSEKHGVNPSVEICFFCMKEVGVVLFGKMSAARKKKMFPHETGYFDEENDAEAPRRVCINKVPCAECKKWMEQGVILISYDPKRSDPKNSDDPHRTGGWVVVREELIRKMFSTESVAEEVLAKRCAFVEDEAWDRIGLPRGDVPADAPQEATEP
jgi:hypothetical protein